MKINGIADTQYSKINFGTEKKRRESIDFKQTFKEMMRNVKTSEVSAAAAARGMGEKLSVDPRMPDGMFGSFKTNNPVPADKSAAPNGLARNFGASGGTVLEHNTIDKTSTLYEQALELESYFVKIMLTSMRQTLKGTSLAGEDGFASKMYKDMLYDELNKSITKNAGFGLADQIYLQLNRS